MKKSCYTCKHFAICYIRTSINEATLAVRILDGEKMLEVWKVVASICNHYQSAEEEEK